MAWHFTPKWYSPSISKQADFQICCRCSMYYKRSIKFTSIHKITYFLWYNIYSNVHYTKYIVLCKNIVPFEPKEVNVQQHITNNHLITEITKPILIKWGLSTEKHKNGWMSTYTQNHTYPCRLKFTPSLRRKWRDTVQWEEQQREDKESRKLTESDIRGKTQGMWRFGVGGEKRRMRRDKRTYSEVVRQKSHVI